MLKMKNHKMGVGRCHIYNIQVHKTWTHQNKKTGNNGQHDHNNDGNDAARQVLHGEGGGLLVHVVDQNVLHLQFLAGDVWLKLGSVLKEGQHLDLEAGNGGTENE